MSLTTDHLERCTRTLAAALAMLRQAPTGSIEYEVYRNAVVKGFELTLETVGSLLRKSLKSYVASARTVDELTYKDVLRHAAKHGLLDAAAVSRWFTYRDTRNSTAHDYGATLAEATLALLPGFIADAQTLATTLRAKAGHGNP